MKSIKNIIAIFVLSIIFSVISANANYNEKESINISTDLFYVPVSTNFNGNTLKVYGATNITGNIIIFINGAKTKYTINKRTNTNGFWLDKVIAVVENTTGYYTIASMYKLDFHNFKNSVFDIGSINIEHDITYKDPSIDDAVLWSNINRLNRNIKHYTYQPQGVKRIGKYLFEATFEMPSDVPVGIYNIKAMANPIGTNQLKGIAQTSVYIGRDGLTKIIYRSARDFPFLYGIIVIILSLSIGLFVGYKKL